MYPNSNTPPSGGHRLPSSSASPPQPQQQQNQQQHPPPPPPPMVAPRLSITTLSGAQLQLPLQPLSHAQPNPHAHHNAHHSHPPSSSRVRFVETAIRGDDVPWKAHPEWFERYDFAVRRPPPPSASSEPVRAETVTYVEHLRRTGEDAMGGGGKGRGGGGGGGSVGGGGGGLAAAGTTGASSTGARVIFFTQFHWMEADGTEHTATREDVIDTFDSLVEAFEQAFMSYLDAHLMLLQPRAAMLNHLPSYKTVYDLAVTLRRRVSLLHDLASGYGEYLSFLSDAEVVGDVPDKWHRHRGPVTSMTLLTSPMLLRPVFYAAISEGTVSDYAFRAAVLVRAEGIPGVVSVVVAPAPSEEGGGSVKANGAAVKGDGNANGSARGGGSSDKGSRGHGTEESIAEEDEDEVEMDEEDALAAATRRAVHQLALEVGIKPPPDDGTEQRKRRTLPSSAARYKRQWEIGWGHWTMW